MVNYSRTRSQSLRDKAEQSDLDTREMAELMLWEYMETVNPTPTTSDLLKMSSNISEELSQSGMSKIEAAQAVADVMSELDRYADWSVRQKQSGAIEFTAKLRLPT